ncbi:MAG: hypothetical protein IJZ89_06845 [Clostridia bacterium]|nr:hypothetical protein [Clostridia bacterium]
MSISGTDIKKNAARTALIYLIISIFTALFGAVYEHFSHSVYSYSMIYAFAFPLICGALPFLILSMRNGKKYPSALSRELYHCGTATLTVGSIVSGILEIYGTTNILISVYPIAGIVLITIGAVIFLTRTVTSKD